MAVGLSTQTKRRNPLDEIKKLFGFRLDEYVLRARIQPALWVMSPLGVLLFIWSPGESLPAGALFAFIATAGGTAALAQFGRDQGRKKQEELWSIWGGAPTTRLMRFRDSVDRVTLDRRRSKIETLTGSALPSEEEEAADPLGADQHYVAATKFLLEKTRDKSQFPLIFAENVNYGFRRNLWGNWRYGLVISVIAAIGSWGIFIATTDPSSWDFWSDSVLKNPDPEVITRMVGSIFNTAAIAIWITVVNPEWVRIAAEAYAERLLASVDALEPTTSEVEHAK